MCTAKWVLFSSILWHLLVPFMVFNSTSATSKLVHHGVWIRAHTFLQVAKEFLLHNYFKLSILRDVLVPVLRLDPTTSWICWTTGPFPPSCIFHIWDSCKFVPRWRPAASECIFNGPRQFHIQGFLYTCVNCCLGSVSASETFSWYPSVYSIIDAPV